MVGMILLSAAAAVMPAAAQIPAGTLRMGVVCKEKGEWIWCAGINKDAPYTYTAKTKVSRGGKLTMKVRNLTAAKGAIVEVTASGMPESTCLAWAFGGCDEPDTNKQRGETDCDIPAQYCRDNVFSIEGDAFTVYHGKVMALRTVQGIIPKGSEIRLTDAHKQDSPMALYASGKKTDAPVISSLCPLKNGEKLYFCIYYQNRTADYAAYMLPKLFESLGNGRVDN